VELHISLDVQSRLAEQIYQQVREAVLDGRLSPGETLPGTRELAARLEVSRNTVSTAYDRLAAEGYLAGRAGVRTYVSDRLDLARRAGPSPLAGSRDAPPAVLIRPVWTEQPDPPDLSVQPEFDFRSGLPDAHQFPYPAWRRLLATALRESRTGTGAYGDPAGDPELRAALARHLGVSRGIRAEAGEVLVTNGVQQGADLVGKVLLEPGDVVAVEDPGYPPPRRLFESFGARVVGVPVDAEGLVVAALPERPRLVFVSPSHQYPLGVSMSLPRRLELLAWAERVGVVILEDDYDSEFRYAGRPIEPLHSLDRAARVVYVGSFSKTLLPTLRLGYCVAPSWLHATLRKARYLTDWHTSLPVQAALTRFIGDGSLARHLRRMRHIYQARRDRLVSVLASDFADSLDPVSSAAGLHLAALLLPGTPPDQTVLDRAARRGVAVHALSRFAVSERGARSGLVLGFGAITLDRIEEGLGRLRDCLDGATTRIHRVSRTVTGSKPV
jgi:GntR family transcriptional regulator/MocR family aminotransferase